MVLYVYKKKYNMADKKMDNRMVVLTENLTGKKYIVWHGPTEVYNTDFTLRGANGDSFTPYADVNYSVDDIRYVFKLREKYFPDDAAIDISLTDLQNLRKDKKVPMSIDGINGSYWNDRGDKYIDVYKNANFFYYPENLCVPKVEVSNPNPSLFNEKTPINIVTYSNTEFISGETKETQNTLPYEPVPYAKIEWTSPLWDNGNVDGQSSSKVVKCMPDFDVQWPLIVKYNPEGFSLSSQEGFCCWDMYNTSYVPYLEFNKKTDENGNVYYEQHIAQLQFGSEYGAKAENTMINNTTNKYMTWPWHFHFDSTRETSAYAPRWYYKDSAGSRVYIDDGYYAQEEFLRQHPYQVYRMKEIISLSESEVFLKVKNYNGKYEFSTVWNANSNKIFNMYARYYPSGMKGIEIAWVKLVLKNNKKPSDSKERAILINYLQPFVRINDSRGYDTTNYIISYHVANDIWMCDEGPSSTEVQLIPERPNPNELFNSTEPEKWVDSENSSKASGNNMDKFVWKGIEYSDRYSLIKDIFNNPQFTDIKTIHPTVASNKKYKGFLWCEEVKSNIDTPTGIVDFGEFLYSTNPNVTLGKEDERLYTTKIDVKSTDTNTLRNTYGVRWSGSQNKYIPCYGRIKDKADITENEFVLYRTWLVVQNEVVGCGFHKILDSGIEFKISQKTPEGNSGEQYTEPVTNKGEWSSRSWSITGVYETANGQPDGTVTKLTYKVAKHGSAGNTYAWKYCHSSNWNNNMLYKAYPTVDELLDDD